MKKEETENLVEKYFSGYTDLEEEAELLGQETYAEPGLKAWFRFVKNKKQRAPQFMQDDIWGAIQGEKRKKRIRLIATSLAAASIAFFFITTNISSHLEGEMDDKMKEAKLQEALSLFPEEVKDDQHVLYEDEMIMIYTSSQ